MKRVNKIEVEIVEMSEFFLYLPVDYAISQKFFGYVDLKKYNIKKRYPKKVRTDEKVCEMLMSEADDFKNIHFAICDPMVVLKVRRLI